MFGASALGQDEDDPGDVIDPAVHLGPEDVVGVRCLPTIVTDNQPVTCVVDLTPDGPHLAVPSLDGPAIVAADSGREAQSKECLADGPSRLICTGLRLFDPGPRTLSFRANSAGTTLDDVAAVTLVRDVSEAFHVSVPTDGEGAVIRGGRPLAFDVLEGPQFVALDPSLGVFATVRPLLEPDSAGMAVVLKEPGSESPPALSIESDPGLYLTSLCVGTDSETCQELPGAFPVRVYALSVRELVPGTTVPGADRINIVVAPSGLASQSQAIISNLLMLDGTPRGVDADGAIVPVDGSQGAVDRIRFGMFAMEPFRSSRHLFNVWLFESQVYQPFDAFFAAVEHPETGAVDGLGLPDASVMVVADEVGRREGARSEARDLAWTASPEGVPRDDLSFGAAWTWVNSSSGPIDAAHVVTHEFGHSLFNLRDEYVDPERAVRFGFPNCAPDEATARSWWQDLVGDLDPFYTEWVSVLSEAGISVQSIDASTVSVGFNAGGCYGTGTEAVRPTADSLMNSQIPVLGAVNRRHVESILGLFAGTKIVESTDIRTAVADMACSGGEAGTPVECSGKIRAYYDVTAGLDLRIGDGDPGACEVTGDPDEGQSFACSAPPFGVVEQSVQLSVADEARFVPTGYLWQPPPPEISIRSLSEDLITAEIVIEDYAGRSVLDVELTVNSSVAWIRTLAASGTEIITGVSPGDVVCVSVRGFPESGDCLTAPLASDDAAASEPPADTDTVAEEDGGFPLVVVVGVAVVLLAGAVFGIRTWWYRY